METPDFGFLFAATGEKYTVLSRRAARTLRAVHPGVPIDLFTDQDVVDSTFDRIFAVERATKRPKIEALRRSRFRRSVCLDSDVIAVAPALDMFELLERYDVIGAHANHRNGPNARTQIYGPIPAGFAALNSGVLGFRRSEATDAFLKEWEAEMVRLKQTWDQPVLRGLLWKRDLKLHILPFDYNLKHHPMLTVMVHGFQAPRFVHVPYMHRLPVDPALAETPLRLEDWLGPRMLDNVGKLLRCDRSVGGTEEIEAVFGPRPGEADPGPVPLHRRLGRRLPHPARRVVRWIVPRR